MNKFVAILHNRTHMPTALHMTIHSNISQDLRSVRLANVDCWFQETPAESSQEKKKLAPQLMRTLERSVIRDVTEKNNNRGKEEKTSQLRRSCSRNVAINSKHPKCRHRETSNKKISWKSDWRKQTLFSQHERRTSVPAQGTHKKRGQISRRP